MKKIYFISTNDYKFKKFNEHFHLENVNVEQLSEETPEIQALDNKTVAEFSAKWAAEKFKVPVIKEDIGMYIKALGGFPGPYLNHIEKWIQTDGFLNLLNGKEDRSAFWEFCISYCEPNSDPVSFSTFPKGTIALQPEGEGGWIADKVFIPEGQDKTISQLIDNKTFQRDNKHYKLLESYLSKK